jgi:hypothetical protein
MRDYGWGNIRNGLKIEEIEKMDESLDIIKKDILNLPEIRKEEVITDDGITVKVEPGSEIEEIQQEEPIIEEQQPEEILLDKEPSREAPTLEETPAPTPVTSPTLTPVTTPTPTEYPRTRSTVKESGELLKSMWNLHNQCQAELYSQLIESLTTMVHMVTGRPATCKIAPKEDVNKEIVDTPNVANENSEI